MYHKTIQIKRLIIFLTVFFLVFPKIYSQSDFRTGYIIKNNNDTIKGLIDYKGNKANSKKCIFKTENNSEKQEFTPNDLKVYRFVDGKYYISKPVKFGDKEEYLFLEYLINGTVDIYYYRDDSGEHYFVDSGDGSLHELKNHEKEVFKNDIRYVKNSKEYIGLLKFTFKESPTISQKVEQIDLNHKSLIKIARDYHKELCSEEQCIIYEKKETKIIKKCGPLVGLNSLSISEEREILNEFYFLRNSQFNKIIYPSVGMFFKINLPVLNEKLFFQYEVTYSHMKLGTTNSYIEPSTDMEYINNIKYKHNAINNSGLIRYEFPKGKFRPVIQVGGFINSYFKVDYTRDLEVMFATGGTYFTEKMIAIPLSKSEKGITLGLGIISKVFERNEICIDFRYQRGLGLVQGLNSNYILLNMGIQFGK